MLLIIGTLVLVDELLQHFGQVFGTHDVFVSKLLLESMKLDGSPRLAALLQSRPIEFVAKLIRNDTIIFCMHNQHRRTEFGNVLIRLEPEAIVINWF